MAQGGSLGTLSSTLSCCSAAFEESLPESNEIFEPTCGIGAALSVNHDLQVFFNKIVPGGAAHGCGEINVGDVLVEVNGWQLPLMDGNEETNLKHLASRIVGPPGTDVEIGVLDRHTGLHKRVQLERRVPKENTFAVVDDSLDTSDTEHIHKGESSNVSAPADPEVMPSTTPHRSASNSRGFQFPVGSLVSSRELRGGDGPSFAIPPPVPPRRSTSSANSRLRIHAVPRNGKETVLSKAMDDGLRRDSLLAASADGAVSRIERLIKVAGVDVNVRDEKWFGDTSLHYSALEGKVDAIQKLVTLGADVNAKNKMGNTPLHYAAMEGNTEAVMRLLRLGGDAMARNKEGRTPFLEAELYKHRAAADTLRAFIGEGQYVKR